MKCRNCQDTGIAVAPFPSIAAVKSKSVGPCTECTAWRLQTEAAGRRIMSDLFAHLELDRPIRDEWDAAEIGHAFIDFIEGGTDWRDAVR